jgi:hypothetical protein
MEGLAVVAAVSLPDFMTQVQHGVSTHVPTGGQHLKKKSMENLD